MAKLSSEYELIVITSFGLNPINIMKIFAWPTLLLCFSLMIISVGLIPKSDYLMDLFIKEKRKEANFNIKESQFGQKFGQWLVYIDKKDGKNFKNITLFKTENNLDQFVLANKAILTSKDSQLSFILIDGKAFYIDKNELNQINYKTMNTNDSIYDTQDVYFTNSYDYWKYYLSKNKDIDDFTFYILTSIFPFISLFLVLIFGYYNPRYDKNRSVSSSLVAVVVYYLIIEYLTKNIGLNALYIVPILWGVVTYFLYKKTVEKLY